MRIGVVGLFAALWCLSLLTLAAPARSSPSARMWDLVRSPEWALTVRSVERRFDPLPAADGTLVRPAGQYAVFAVDLTNRTDRPLLPAPGDFVLRTAAGVRFANLADGTVARTHATAADRVPFGAAVAPGATVTTIVLFDIDAHAGRLTLDFVPAGQSIHIDECKCDLPSPVRSIGNGSGDIQRAGD